MIAARIDRLFVPVPRRIFVILLVLYVLLRLYLATLPGYANDVDSYKRWALGTAQAGLAAAYESTRVDYPPLFLYVLYTLGRVYRFFDPGAAPDALPSSAALTFLIKLPHLVFDLLLAGLLYRLVAGMGSWGARLRTAGVGRLAALLYLWNPAVLWGSAYWGQPDGIHSALAVAALAALAGGSLVGSGALLSAAGLMKPLAAPLVPLLAAAAMARNGLRGALRTGLGGLGLAVLVFAPFWATGRIGPVLSKVLLDVEAMPFTSVNAHNLWWILGAWRDANAALIGPLTPKLLGLILFMVAYAMLLARSLPWLGSVTAEAGDYAARLFVNAAAVTCAFFFLSTHMHENHLFMAVPFLLAVAGRGPHLALLFCGASLAATTNMMLHDLELPQRLPGVLAAVSPVIDPHLGRPYTWVQVVGSFLNAILVAAVAFGSYLAAWRGDPRDGAASRN